MTIALLTWCCTKLEALGKMAWLLGWDQAPWHRSHAVRRWIQVHNQQVKRTGTGVRLVVCPLPTKSPWLNPLEPRWVHGKRRRGEPTGLLTAPEVITRVSAYFGCQQEEHLLIPEKVS